MQFRICNLLVLVMIGIKGLSQPLDPKDILKKSANILKSITLFKYESQYRIKSFDSSDTTELTNYRCIVAKAPHDTILNFYARIICCDSVESIYDGDSFYVIWHSEKSIIKDSPHLTNRNFTVNNIKRTNVPYSFYSESPFKSYLTEALDVQLQEVTYRSKKSWKIKIVLPSNEEVTLLERIIYIDAETYLPVRFEGYAKYMNIQSEFWELNINNNSVESISDLDFSKYYTYPANYKENVYEVPNIKYDLLPNASKAIPFEGKDITGDLKNIDFKKEHQLLLIDFWYLGCSSCIKSMPKLEELSKKYNDQGLVVMGLNPFDDLKSKSIEFNKFIERLKIKYPLLSVTKKTAELYQVKVYPTIYLVKNGQIIHSQTGFSENKMNTLENIVKENLSK